MHAPIEANEITSIVSSFYNTDRVPYFVGRPGIAKTAMVREAANQLSKLHGEPVPVVEMHLASMSEVDIRGYLIPNGDQAVFTKPVFWEMFERYDRGILFFDEFPQASHEVQKACAPLILDGAIGVYTMRSKPGWKIVLAGNGTEDSCGANTILAHVTNRICQIPVKAPDVDKFVAWGASAGMVPELLAFAKLRPNVVFDSPIPDEPDTPFCTCRSLHAVSDLAHVYPGGIVAMATTPVGLSLIAGFIGTGAAAELCGLVKTACKLPSFEEVMANPDSVPLPTELDEVYASIMLIAVRAKASEHCEQAATYLTRFQPNFALVGIVSLIARDSGFVNSKRFGQWVKDNRPLLAKFQNYILAR